MVLYSQFVILLEISCSSWKCATKVWVFGAYQCIMKTMDIVNEFYRNIENLEISPISRPNQADFFKWPEESVTYELVWDLLNNFVNAQNTWKRFWALCPFQKDPCEKKSLVNGKAVWISSRPINNKKVNHKYKFVHYITCTILQTAPKLSVDTIALKDSQAVCRYITVWLMNQDYYN